MKKLVLPFLVLTSYLLTAQEEISIQEETSIEVGSENKYDKWSIEISGGMHKPSRPFANGYATSTPSFGQAGLGVRYMFNNKFGLRLGLGYGSVENDDNSLPFKSTYYRSTLEGVINLTNVLNFQDWTNTFGLLVHGGAGYSFANYNEPVELDVNDQMLNFMVGVTPQVKLGNGVALFGDVSAIGHTRQTLTWDGTEVSHTRGLDGFTVNFSLGLSFYLGAAEKHADWYSEKNSLKEKVVGLEDRVAKLEADLIDSDQDGVPNYLDREQNTMSGVTVDSKGVAVDRNNNNIPDEIESSLDNRFVNEEDYIINGGISIEELINKGYVNVYFQFNSDKPEAYSLSAINYLIKYMQENTTATAELIGYADELGQAEFNVELSKKRAKKVYDILTASGIAESRLSFTGKGEDASVEKSSSPARQLVRRVTFRLK